MRPSDDILQHVVRQHFVPAWRAGKEQITLRAGDIHRELGYQNRMPAVCSVLGSDRLQRLARVRLAERQGPQNGSNARFRFELRA